MIKKIIQAVAALCVFAVFGFVAYYTLNSVKYDFETICDDKGGKKYTEELCNNIGKHAWSKKSVVALNEKDYGVIIGVSWREQGSLISPRSQKERRSAENDAYYYIVASDSKGSGQFLRLASETDPR